MGFDLDFLTQIVNVNWEGGLAVEFTDRPDCLTMNHALSMNKMIISFWFRVPTEAAKATRAKINPFWAYRVFLNVVPLITWGPQHITPVSTIEIYDTGAINVSAGAITLERVGPSHTAPMQPSGIGLYVGFEGDPTLDVHIQTNAHAIGTGLAHIQTAFTGDFAGIDIHSGKPIYANIKYTKEDVSYMITEEPDYLGNSDSNSSGSGAGYPEVGKLDEWHHLLISWELKSMSNMDNSFSKMWCAIDDKNKAGPDLPAMNDPSVMGPNDHMSWMPWNWQGNADASVSVSFGSDNIPADPFRIPGPPTVNTANNDSGNIVSIAPIEKVELAELQIFSGVTLDTSSEKNRRAFIDFRRDANGKPIKDENGKMILEPVDPKKAEELLGKRPAILLHGAGDWQKGKNIGSLGLTSADPPAEISGGQFKPTGVIEKYTPDPSIKT